jgi:hypothetical protein
MLKELVLWIVSRVNGLGASPALVVGGNVQVGFRAQDAPVRCHTFLDSGGPADFDLPYRTDMMLQVATRGETIVQARADAWEIYSAIHGTSGWTIGPLVSGGRQYKIWSIGALAKPQYIGIEEDGGFFYSCNYLILASPA